MTEPRDEARDVLAEAGLREALRAALPRAVNFRVPVALPIGSQVWDQIAADLAAALAARGYRLAAEPAPDVEALRARIGAVIDRWYHLGLIRFGSRDDGSDDLLLRDELLRAALHRADSSRREP